MGFHVKRALPIFWLILLTKSSSGYNLTFKPLLTILHSLENILNQQRKLIWLKNNTILINN
jgi:hypothetical protein